MVASSSKSFAQSKVTADSTGKSVLVLGAGISGATVAKRLSEAGCQVHLYEKQGSIGGHAAEMGCKAVDVCLRCNVCVADKLLREVAAADDIHIHLRAELTKLEAGTNGCRYTATLKHEPTFIDSDKCIGCQACVNACPEKCIVKPKVALSVAVPMVDCASCRHSLGKDCSVCEEICPAAAINMGQHNSKSNIDVDTVVLATGYEPYDPTINASYGYGRISNIITGTEAEKQLASQHTITRPSDGLPAKRIAFIQCVGSRTEQVHRRPEDCNYCSGVCCPYALRIAQLMKYQNNDCELTVFYMDIQDFGKGFDEFYRKCQANVTLIRSRPYELKQGQNGSVRVKYTPQSFQEEAESQACEAEFDLVVLSVGIRPAQSAVVLADALQIPVDEHGFFGLKGAQPLPVLQRKGIFVTGACESPKDIGACIAQAEAVSQAVIGEV